MVTLLHFRHRLGLGVFSTALGVMHFMETYLAAVFYVSLPFGVVSPGSSVFFSGKLMMILMLYLQEDASTVRQPIYGLFLGNLLTVGIAWVLQMHQPLEISPATRRCRLPQGDGLADGLGHGAALSRFDSASSCSTKNSAISSARASFCVS